MDYLSFVPRALLSCFSLHLMKQSRLSQPSTSQGMSQSQCSQSQAVDSDMVPEEREKKINDLVQYLLVMDQKKLPIKKRDINKIVLKESSRAFNSLMEEASKRMLMVFGFCVVELVDKLKGSYILVNILENDRDERHLKWSSLDTTKMSLVSIILSVIFMNGNVIEESDLWHALRVFGINQQEYDSTFGDVKNLITDEFVRQGYLDIKTQTTSESTVKEFRWGQRAVHEFKRKNALNLVSDVYECDPQVWLHQWQQVQEEEAAGSNGDHPMEIE